ncbi:MAG TPA: DinB family protein [Candidatus Acidoferrum sp.]
MRKALFAFLLLFSVRPLLAQTAPEGIWQGYDGEWRHVSGQLLALAEAIPEEKFTWRPAPGVRSTSEVFMHIALANFYLLSVTGPKMPADMKEGLEKSVTSKAEVISWLNRSLEAGKSAHLAVTPNDLPRKVHIYDRDATVDGMYLRILVHANEHMGQLIAYARMTGVAPPGPKISNRHSIRRGLPSKHFISVIRRGLLS